MHDAPQQWIVFTLDEQRYALPINSVKRIVHAVEVTPLPKAPEIVLGVISLQGQVIPVVNIRKRFGLPDRELELNDHFVIAQTSQRIIALAVDVVSSVVERFKEEIIPSKKVLSDIEYIAGIIRLEDGLILVHDLHQLLSLEEVEGLENAMKEN